MIKESLSLYSTYITSMVSYHGFAIIPKSSHTKQIHKSVWYITLFGQQQQHTNFNFVLVIVVLLYTASTTATSASLDFSLSNNEMNLFDGWGDTITLPY